MRRPGCTASRTARRRAAERGDRAVEGGAISASPTAAPGRRPPPRSATICSGSCTTSRISSPRRKNAWRGAPAGVGCSRIRRRSEPAACSARTLRSRSRRHRDDMVDRHNAVRVLGRGAPARGSCALGRAARRARSRRCRAATSRRSRARRRAGEPQADGPELDAGVGRAEAERAQRRLIGEHQLVERHGVLRWTWAGASQLELSLDHELAPVALQQRIGGVAARRPCASSRARAGRRRPRRARARAASPRARSRARS